MAKWNHRLDPSSPLPPSSTKHITPLLPKSFAKYNNIQTIECPVCKNGVRASALHLNRTHSLQIPQTITLIEELELTFPRVANVTPRAKILQNRDRKVLECLKIITDFLSIFSHSRS